MPGYVNRNKTCRDLFVCCCFVLFVAFVCFGGFLDNKSWYNKLDCVFKKERKKERKKVALLVTIHLGPIIICITRIKLCLICKELRTADILRVCKQRH